MLSASLRFHGHNSLRYVYKNGKAVRNHFLTVRYVANRYRKESRFAVVVSKKIHKSAVRRNRTRRRVYEAIRKELPYLKNSFDVVILVFSSEVSVLPDSELRQTLQQLLKQADLYR